MAGPEKHPLNTEPPTPWGPTEATGNHGLVINSQSLVSVSSWRVPL